MRFKELHCVLHMLAACVFAFTAELWPKGPSKGPPMV